MLIKNLPLKFQRRANPKPGKHQPTPPPAALVLTAAQYEEMTWVELTFDRAIDISNMDVGQIAVDDPVSGFVWTGTDEPVSTGANSVRVELAEAGPASAGSVVLDASANTGIVAEDDGGTWAGVTELGLPYP